MHSTQLRRVCGAALAALLLTIGLTVTATGQDGPVPGVGAAPQPEPASTATPSGLPPDQQALIRQLVEQEVKKRLAEEAKQKADKEKEEVRRTEEQGFEVGKYRDLKGTWTNGVQWSSADASFRFHLGGRVDFDNVFYTQSDSLRLGVNDNTRLQDASGFRRARLRADGSFWENLDFAVEVNFANFQDFSNTDQNIVVGAVGLTDVNLTFRDVPYIGNARIGHFAPPIGLEHVTSNSFWYYMERSPQFDTFINRFDYVNGVMLFDSYLDDRVTFAAAVARTGSRTVNPFGAGGGDGEYGFVVRGTGLPVWGEEGRRLVHVGMSVMGRVLDNRSTSPGSRPLVRAGASRDDLPNVVQTGNIFAPEGAYYFNGELAGVYGPFSASAECLWVYMPSTFASRSAAGAYSDSRGPVSYYGAYVESGVFVTPGDYRRYNRATGSWDRTVPAQNGFAVRGGSGRPIIGRGAVQLVCRYSYLDLAGGTPTFSPTVGARAGTTQDVTLGVNWYLNPQAVISANYVRTHVSSVAPGRRGSFDGFGIRLHFDF